MTAVLSSVTGTICRVFVEYKLSVDTITPLHSKDQTADRDYPNRYAPIVPNGEKCQFTGLGHARLYQLLNGPARKHVRVASLREPGKTRGTRLFHVGDLLRFLDKLASEQLAPVDGGRAA